MKFYQAGSSDRILFLEIEYYEKVWVSYARYSKANATFPVSWRPSSTCRCAPLLPRASLSWTGEIGLRSTGMAEDEYRGVRQAAARALGSTFRQVPDNCPLSSPGDLPSKKYASWTNLILPFHSASGEQLCPNYQILNGLPPIVSKPPRR